MDKFKILRSVGAECSTDEELRKVLDRGRFRLYDGFEPSGRMHVAQGLMKAANVNKCTSVGGHFVFWVADWFALMNDKMGGDLEMIQKVGKYFIEIWKSSGMNMENVEFRWSSEDIKKHRLDYWRIVLDVGRCTTLPRVKKCGPIMGRSDEESLTCAQILYPLMQSADIFFLNTDICQLGMDQRKVNMLARDYAKKAKKKIPVVLSHGMMKGLKEGQAKMSKSDPDSAIFMEDSAEEVERKLKQAYFPKNRETNPVYDYCDRLIFANGDSLFESHDIDELAEKVETKKISEIEVKSELAKVLNEKLGRVRENFQNSQENRELLKSIQEFVANFQEDPNLAKKSEVFCSFPKYEICILLPLPHSSASAEPNEVCRLPHFSTYLTKTSEDGRTYLPPNDSVYPSLENLFAVFASYVEKKNLGREICFYAPDLTAFSLNCLEGNQKAILAYFRIFEFALESFAEEKLKFVNQSDVSLENDYFLSLINCAREFSVKKICSEKSGETTTSGIESAGQVVGHLLTCNDLVGLRFAEEVIIFENSEIVEMFEEIVKTRKLERRVEFKIERRRINHTKISIEDSEMILSSKIKKCFCKPENVEFNPLLEVSRDLLRFSSLKIKRIPENGGNLVFEDCESLKASLRENLHPGDFKPACREAIMSLFKKVDRKETEFSKNCKIIKNLK